MLNKLLVLFLGIGMLVSCSNGGEDQTIEAKEVTDGFILSSGKIKLQFDKRGTIDVFKKLNETWISVVRSVKDPYSIRLNGQEVDSFNLQTDLVEINTVDNEMGIGKQIILPYETTTEDGVKIRKLLTVDLYASYPTAGLIQAKFININSIEGLLIEKEIDARFIPDASKLNASYKPNNFWILQGGSYNSRPDWILPVDDTFSYRNDMAPNKETRSSGGGLPVLDVWAPEGGFFIGSAREKPTMISLPAKVDSLGYLNISIEYERVNHPFTDSYLSIPTIIGVHDGDYYNGLRTYAEVMTKRGVDLKKPDPSSPAYDPIWCAWGLGPDFEAQKILEMVPQVKGLGFEVVTIDYGWFENYGDFDGIKEKIFEEGEKSMVKFISELHNRDLLTKAWITPGVAGPNLMKAHPEWLIREEDGTILNTSLFINQEGAFLCPAIPEVKQYYKDLMEKILVDWGYDGLKMDFSLINAMSRCYTTEHHHDSPEESFEELPGIYKVIHDESKRLKPRVILEVCPCGRFPSFYKMPYYNQPVASDPNSAWQIRHRAKTIKALMGPSVAFYGDHVERYFSRGNFASMIGTGGIPGSMFVSEVEDQYPHPSHSLDSGTVMGDREGHFKKWINIYSDHELSKGTYLNLYDIAYDKPETHLVKRDSSFYYAFYADAWDDGVEFRGLGNGEWILEDYVNSKVLDTIRAGEAIKVEFQDFLLIRAIQLDN